MITDYLTLGTSPRCMTVEELRRAVDLLESFEGAAAPCAAAPDLPTIIARRAVLRAELEERENASAS